MEIPEPSTAGPAPALDMSLSVKGNELHLAYKVRNPRRQPVYLFNVLWDFPAKAKGGQLAASSPVYACLRPNRNLHLAKQILPLPRNRKVELRILPFATRLEPDQEFEEVLRWPLPVAEYNPYFPVTPESKFEARPAETVAFTLQWLAHTDDLQVKPAPLPGALQLWHPQLLARVETLQFGPVRMAVKVNKRLDAFEDF
jgi:hypothetical protein